MISRDHHLEGGKPQKLHCGNIEWNETVIAPTCALYQSQWRRKSTLLIQNQTLHRPPGFHIYQNKHVISKLCCWLYYYPLLLTHITSRISHSLPTFAVKHVENLKDQRNGKRKSMTFAVPIVWSEDHITNCSFCIINLIGINRKNKYHAQYPDVLSVIGIPHVPDGNIASNIVAWLL